MRLSLLLRARGLTAGAVEDDIEMPSALTAMVRDEPDTG
ncbi:Hypothetical Protein RSKD131_3882 [Cereibacter sphaeroides KD131]|nr:Hypothetical Protein RSKD131_3882 [Cereibacter sphaeroides KD131]